MLRQNLLSFVYLCIFVTFQINMDCSVVKSETLRESRIINGNIANLNSARHQVSIRYRKDDDKQFGSGHICGGSLISDNVVLTAAHCLLGKNLKYYSVWDLVAVMGNLDRFENNSNTLKFNISKIIKGSLKVELDGDIALIILNGTVPTHHPTVQPIILNDGILKSNTLCYATGWGLTEEDDLSSLLRIVDLPLIDINDCRNKTEYGLRILDGMFCAGYLEGGRDVCTGDSGGPLVCQGLQAGIVSWGTECSLPLNPGVYTDVFYYKEWILKQVADNNASLPKFDHVRNRVNRFSVSLTLVTLLLIINIFAIPVIS